MIFSALKSLALHNQVHKSQRKKKELKIHYYHILCSHVSPLRTRGGNGGDKGEEGHIPNRNSCLGGPSPSAGGILERGAITYLKPCASPLLQPPPDPTRHPQAPPRSVVAFVIVIWPCLLNASTVYSPPWGFVWTGVSRMQGDITFGWGGVTKKKEAAFVFSAFPPCSF